MEKERKIQITGEIEELVNAASSIYLTDFSGMTVAEISELRDEFFKAGVKYRVVKNTLALRAIKQSGNFSEFEDLISKSIKGPTGIVFSGTDPVAPAKILKKFFEKTQRPKLKAAIVEQEFYDSEKLDLLASLLSKDELIAGILSSLNSPVSGIVGAINACIRDLSSVIEEVAKKKAA
jgi:large subunit ribosomal protein L10